MNFVYDDCSYRAISDRLRSEFACVVPWLPRSTWGNGVEICRFDHTTAEGIARRELVMERYDFLSSSGMRGLCPLPCASMEVFLGE